MEVWKRARTFTREIYSLTAQRQYDRDWNLKDQLRSAAVSIMSNLAEGFDSVSSLEFARFLNIARRSASEVQSELYVSLDQGYLDQKNFERLYSEAEEIRRMLTGFAKYLRARKKLG